MGGYGRSEGQCNVVLGPLRSFCGAWTFQHLGAIFGGSENCVVVFCNHIMQPNRQAATSGINYCRYIYVWLCVTNTVRKIKLFVGLFRNWTKMETAPWNGEGSLTFAVDRSAGRKGCFGVKCTHEERWLKGWMTLHGADCSRAVAKYR